MTTITFYTCPECGGGYDGEGRIGTDYHCPCGCIIGAASADKVRCDNMWVRALILGWFYGLLCVFGFLFIPLPLPWLFYKASLFLFPITWLIVLLVRSFKREDCRWEFGSMHAVLILINFGGSGLLFMIIWGVHV